MAKSKKQQINRQWLIPDRLLAAQSRYALRRMKKEIVKFPGASSLMNQRIDELIWLLDSAKEAD